MAAGGMEFVLPALPEEQRAEQRVDVFRFRLTDLSVERNDLVDEFVALVFGCSLKPSLPQLRICKSVSSVSKLGLRGEYWLRRFAGVVSCRSRFRNAAAFWPPDRNDYAPLSPPSPSHPQSRTQRSEA